LIRLAGWSYELSSDEATRLRSALAWSLAAGVSLFNLSRRMGTSIAQIDATYGHLAPDAEEYERGLLDAYDARFGHLSGIEAKP